MRRLGRLFFHPWVKTFAFALSGLLGNVFAGTYVFEITKTVNGSHVLDWAETLHSRSFWFLVAVLVLTCVYGWTATRFEIRTRRSVQSDMDLWALVLSELSSPLIKAAKKEIKDGKLRSMEDVRKMFGLERGGGQS